MDSDPYSWQSWDAEQNRASDLGSLDATIYQNETNSGRNVHTSSAGARGPMQIMPATFAQYAQPGESIDNPDDNMAVGKRIIADLYDRYGGNKDDVLVGYNAGPGHVGQPFDQLPAETQNYIRKAHQEMGDGSNFIGAMSQEGGQTLRGLLGARADAAAQSIGVSPDQPVDLNDPSTRQALTDAGFDMGAHRAVPAPSVTTPGPHQAKVIGPFSDSFSAYDAAPQDRDNYYLLNRGGQWMWQPKGAIPADTNPLAPSPYVDDAGDAAAADRKLINSPVTSQAQIGNAVMNIGRAFNGYLAKTLDTPFDIADEAIGAVAGWMGYSRPAVPLFGHPFTQAAHDIGLETEPKGEDMWANLGTGIGSGLGMAAPFLLTGGAAGAGLLGEGAGATALARGTGFANGLTAGTAASEAAGAAAGGVGQMEAHDLYQSQTGRSGDLGDIASQIIGGGLFNAARIPVLTAAEKAAGTAVGKAWNGAKQGIAAMRGGGTAAEADAPLDATTGKKVTDQVLSKQLSMVLAHADQSVAAMGTSSPEASADFLADRSAAARTAVSAFAKGSRAEEQAMWNEVNPAVPIDFSASRNLYASQRAAHFTNPDGTATLRASSDFPTWLDPLLGSKQEATGLLDASGNPITRTQNGLQDFDTLGRGQAIASRLNQAIEDEKMALGRAQNTPLIGYMQRIRNSLMQDMQNTPGGVDNPEIDAYRRAMAFSKSRSEIMESPEMSQFLSARVGDASALSKLLRQGPQGADATKILLGAANAKYGAGGLLDASKDALRQMYTDAVAPRGFVDPNAHEVFMRRYGATLQDPAFQDVAKQFETAASSARDVNNTLGSGKPTYFGRSESALDQRNAAVNTYLQAPTETVIRNLENASNSTQATLQTLDRLSAADPTGRAALGFQHQIAQRALDDPKWIEKNQGIISAIDRRNPGFADRLTKYTQPGTLAGIMKQVTDAAGAYVGARAGGKLAEGGFGSSFLMAGRGAKITEGLSRQIREQVTNIRSANIVDAEADAAWDRLNGGVRGKLYTAAQHARDAMLLHSYVPALAIGNLPTGGTDNAGTGLPGAPVGPPAGSVPWQQLVPTPSQPSPSARGANSAGASR